MLLEFNTVERFGKCISGHIVCGTILKPDLITLREVADIMVLDVDMFILLVDGLIVDCVDAALVVDVDRNWVWFSESLHVGYQSRKPNRFLACGACGNILGLAR